jgi:hypothetical protein
MSLLWGVLEKILLFELQKTLMEMTVYLEDQALDLLQQLQLDSYQPHLEQIPVDLSDNQQVCVE